MCAWIRACGGSGGTSTNVLYDNGSGIENWDNSGYKAFSVATCDGGFTINTTNLTCPNITTNDHNRSILTTNTIDFSKYSTLYVTYNGSNTVTVDISSITERGYIGLNGVMSESVKYFQVCVSRVKVEFGAFNNRYTKGDVSAISMPFTVNKVWLKK